MYWLNSTLTIKGTFCAFPVPLPKKGVKGQVTQEGVSVTTKKSREKSK